MRASFTAALTCAVAAGSAFGQSFNIDIGSSAGVPSPAFGGPANQPGFWNVIDGGPTSYGLTDVRGAATGVTVESTWFFRDPNNPAPAPNNPQPSTAFDPDVAAYLDDFFYLEGDVLTELTFFGLQPGLYDLVVAAIRVGFPTEPTNITWISSDLNEFADDITGDGDYNGVWEQGLTHTNLRVPVGPDGQMRLLLTGVFTLEIESFGNINGIQLVQVPEPAALGLLLTGLLGAVRRR